MKPGTMTSSPARALSERNEIPPCLRETWRPSSKPSSPQKRDGTTEQRSSRRKRVEKAVAFATDRGTRCAGLCRDVGLGGLRILTPTPPSPGTRLTVFMQLEGVEGDAALTGIVRWADAGAIGIQFDPYGIRITSGLLRMLQSGED